MAVGSDENCVDFYDVSGTQSGGQAYNKLGYCKELKQPVEGFMQLDFSADSLTLRVSKTTNIFTNQQNIQTMYIH